MKKLNINQMEQAQGGVSWCVIICISIGQIFSDIATGVEMAETFCELF